MPGKKPAKIRVVVAEDHAALRALTRDVLERTDRFDVVGEAVNGDDAVAVARREKPDLVLLDLKMPGRDGFQALPDILVAAPRAKIVAYSMLDRLANEARVLQLGAVAYIEKDADSNELVTRLLALFDGPSDGRGTSGPPPRRNTRSLNQVRSVAWPRFFLPQPTAIGRYAASPRSTTNVAPSPGFPSARMLPRWAATMR